MCFRRYSVWRLLRFHLALPIVLGAALGDQPKHRPGRYVSELDTACSILQKFRECYQRVGSDLLKDLKGKSICLGGERE
jgi:hypothetical protein